MNVHKFDLPVRYVHVDGPTWEAHFADGTILRIQDGEASYPNLKFRPGYHEVEYLAVVEFLAEAAPGSKRVLDAACGSGMGSAYLWCHGHDVTGVDADAGCVSFAKRVVSCVSFDAQKLPDLAVEPESFDVVVSIETIEHIDQDSATMAAYRRALKPNGLLVLSTPDAEARAIRQLPANAYHKREYTTHELRALVDGTGFTVARHVTNPLGRAPLTQMVFARKGA